MTDCGHLQRRPEPASTRRPERVPPLGPKSATKPVWRVLAERFTGAIPGPSGAGAMTAVVGDLKDSAIILGDAIGLRARVTPGEHAAVKPMAGRTDVDTPQKSAAFARHACWIHDVRHFLGR